MAASIQTDVKIQDTSNPIIPVEVLTIREKVKNRAFKALACLAAPFKACFNYLVRSKTTIVNLVSYNVSKIAHTVKKFFVSEKKPVITLIPAASIEDLQKLPEPYVYTESTWM